MPLAAICSASVSMRLQVLLLASFAVLTAEMKRKNECEHRVRSRLKNPKWAEFSWATHSITRLETDLFIGPWR